MKMTAGRWWRMPLIPSLGGAEADGSLSDQGQPRLLQDHITKSNIKIQCNPHQNSSDLHNMKKINPKYSYGNRKNSQTKTKQAELAGGVTVSDFRL